MTVKEELSQYRFKVKKVDETLAEYERYKTRAEKMTAILSEVPSRTNKTSDKVGLNASIMADLKEEYILRWAEAEKEASRILNDINSIEEPYRTILSLRYIQGKRLEYIAEELHYSYPQIKRLHGISLLVYQKQKDDTKWAWMILCFMK